MVRFLLTLTLCLSFFGVSAKTYFSAMHGDWEDPSNWFENEIGNPACEVPGPGDYTLVYHSMEVHHDLLIGSGGNLALIGVGQLRSKHNLTILQGGRFENFAKVEFAEMLVSGALFNLGLIHLHNIRIGGKLKNTGEIACSETFNVDRSGMVYSQYGQLQVGPYRVSAETIKGSACINGIATAHRPVVSNRGSSPIFCSIIIPE